MQKITPCLWYDTQAEQAAEFYVSVFSKGGKSSKILKISRYTAAGQEIHGKPPGSVLTVEFSLDGQRFMALNGGTYFKLTEAVSFVVNCKTQEEVDYYWGKLSAVKASEQCGWVKDKFGLSWQIVPEILAKLLTDKDTVKSDRVMVAMLKMKKLDIKALEKAYKG
jgi:predicted 3-demethylubiquinone-9 3-methyltransferase (glyoxalase superfamily)